ncbi:unnamed protein product [Allacma fusca]|uniref:Uncharacterized protein n=1 Tax=Allacma fusca TaxID=39272 RepID=A0A8J2L2Q0_9HEXA|nr:unnamed protein product [Allacma fusca]
MQKRTPAMVKVAQMDESQLCDDILSCILALDEVIAEFDDSHSISSPLEPPASSATSFIAPSAIVPIAGDSEENNRSLPTPVRQGSSFSSTSPSQSVRRQNLFPLSSSALTKLSQPSVMSTAPSQFPSKLQGELSISNADKDKTYCVNKEEGEKSVSLQEMEQDLSANVEVKRKKSSPGSAGSRIPSLKSPTSAIPIIPANTSNTGGGGSFPKVKLRSSNPLLEYRSVKMQNFILPDELPSELVKENWNFPTGKNLPRSLSRTRDTCIGEGDSADLKSANPRFKESKGGEPKGSSRIPKLKLDICNVYEDANSNHSQNPEVKSPSSSSEGAESPGVTNGRNYSSNISNIPIPKPRRNSPTTHNTPFAISAIKNAANAPKNDSVIGCSPQGKSNVSSLPKSPSDFSSGISRHNESFNESDIQFYENCGFSNGQTGPETDDGYLSMVNKMEDSPLLWPEEMVENETFTDDELKRLSYKSDDPYFAPNLHNNEFGTEKTDYFSDDSLESENLPTINKGTYSKSSNPLIKNKRIPAPISFVCQVDFIRPAVKSPQSPASDKQPRSPGNQSSPLRKPCSFFVPIESNAKCEYQKEPVPVPAPVRLRKQKRPPLCCISDQSNDLSRDSPVESPFQPVAHDHVNEVENAQPPQPVATNNMPNEMSPAETILTPTPAKIILDKIEDFAEKLAWKIERSGSEEAAATLALYEVEAEIENINSQAALITTSENPRVESSREMSGNSPSSTNESGHEENQRKISPAIMDFISEDNESDSLDPQSLGFQDERTLVAPPRLGRIADSPVTGDDLSERQLKEFQKETDSGKSDTRDAIKSLESAVDKSQRLSEKLDDDNLSDDLSETPPQFIPDPPPIEEVLVEMNTPTPQAVILDQVSHPKELEALDQLSITKNKSQLPTNNLSQNERNSRSSEDIIKAVNNDSRHGVVRNRPGASTLPLNTRPPVDGRGSFRPLRNMLSRFRKSKHKQSNMSLSDETGLTQSSSAHGSRPQELNEENADGTEGTEVKHTKAKRRNSSASGSKKTSILIRQR